MDEKKITPVVDVGNITVKKKPFTQKFKEAFISQDFKSAAKGVNDGVVIPAIKKLIADGISNVVNSMLFGSSTPINGGFRINPSTWSWNGITYSGQNVNYSGVSTQTTIQQTVVPNAGRYKYDEIIIQPDPSKGETMGDAERHADDILFSLKDQLERFGSVTINDLFELCGLPMVSTLGNYGWKNLRDADKVLIPGQGFWLKLPNPTLLR